MFSNYSYWCIGRILDIKQFNDLESVFESIPVRDIIPFHSNIPKAINEIKKMYDKIEGNVDIQAYTLLDLQILEYQLGDEQKQHLVCGSCLTPRPVNQGIKGKFKKFVNKCTRCVMYICKDCAEDKHVTCIVCRGIQFFNV